MKERLKSLGWLFLAAPIVGAVVVAAELALAASFIPAGVRWLVKKP